MIMNYKSALKQSKIDSAPIPEQTEDVLELIKYKDRANYTFTYHYKRKYHFGEIFNRLLCQESNKPNLTEINQIKLKLNDDFTLKNIYKNTTYNQRKHLIYIYHILNNLQLPVMTSEINRMKEGILFNLNKFYSLYGNTKTIKYRLIMDVICEKFNYTPIRPLLFFKDNQKHREIVKQILNF